MIDLNFKNGAPIYEQLVEKIKKLIIKGVMKPDEKLPSVRILAQELTINPNTIQRAYRELEKEGYLHSLPGKGSFISRMDTEDKKQKIQLLKETLMGTAEELFYLGIPKESILDWISDLREEGDIDHES